MLEQVLNALYHAFRSKTAEIYIHKQLQCECARWEHLDYFHWTFQTTKNCIGKPSTTCTTSNSVCCLYIHAHLHHSTPIATSSWSHWHFVQYHHWPWFQQASCWNQKYHRGNGKEKLICSDTRSVFMALLLYISKYYPASFFAANIRSLAVPGGLLWLMNSQEWKKVAPWINLREYNTLHIIEIFQTIYQCKTIYKNDSVDLKQETAFAQSKVSSQMSEVHSDWQKACEKFDIYSGRSQYIISLLSNP